MNKIQNNYCIFIIFAALIIGKWLSLFEVQLMFYTVIGILISVFFKPKRLFVKVFLMELIISIVIYFIYREHSLYVESIVETINLPSFVVPILFVLINALTAAFTFQLGASLNGLVGRK
jgi:hypothetical protein